jgi:hypothetical protein
MTLAEVIKAVDKLSPDEIRQLRDYLDKRETQAHPHNLSVEERIRLLDKAFDRLREGLTEAELKDITEAINAEYIEPWDDSEWQP